MINRSTVLSLQNIIDGVNTYIKSLNDEDGLVRVKDTLNVEDAKLIMEAKPIQMLLL
jgi:hypothetical protein